MLTNDLMNHGQKLAMAFKKVKGQDVQMQNNTLNYKIPWTLPVENKDENWKKYFVHLWRQKGSGDRSFSKSLTIHQMFPFFSFSVELS